MRNAFADEMVALAQADPRIVLLTADIGNRLFDKYRAAFPDRFYNCGIAEANMISMAAGMASCGLLPVCYTIAPFITARCFEQIRVDVSYHEMPVTIVGTGSGLSYASLGVTHHSLEDIALLRSLPGMRVLAPADAMELRAALRLSAAGTGATYIRMGKKGEPVIFSAPPALEFGKWNPVRAGTRVAFLVAGTLLPVVVEAADRLRAEGTDPAIYSCASVKPLDEEELAGVFDRFSLVVTVEEHSKIGGFGAAVAEWCVDRPTAPRARLLRCAAGDFFLHEATSQELARSVYGIDAGSIAKFVRDRLSGMS